MGKLKNLLAPIAILSIGILIFSFSTNDLETESTFVEPEKEKKEEVKEEVFYNVNFDTDGDIKIESQKVKEGELIKKPEDPEKEGYVFKYWTLDDKEFDFTIKIDKDITLKAFYEEEEVETTVTGQTTSRTTTETTTKKKTNQNNDVTTPEAEPQEPQQPQTPQEPQEPQQPQEPAEPQAPEE